MFFVYLLCFLPFCKCASAVGLGPIPLIGGWWCYHHCKRWDAVIIDLIIVVVISVQHHSGFVGCFLAFVVLAIGYLVVVVLCADFFSHFCCLWCRQWWSATSVEMVGSFSCGCAFWLLAICCVVWLWLMVGERQWSSINTGQSWVVAVVADSWLCLSLLLWWSIDIFVVLDCLCSHLCGGCQYSLIVLEISKPIAEAQVIYIYSVFPWGTLF